VEKRFERVGKIHRQKCSTKKSGKIFGDLRHQHCNFESMYAFVLLGMFLNTKHSIPFAIKIDNFSYVKWRYNIETIYLFSFKITITQYHDQI
jgi:hypothetical protein